jgi:hypothetical protein
MLIQFDASEQKAARDQIKKISALLGDIPGTGGVRKTMDEFAAKPIDVTKVGDVVNSNEVRLTIGEDGTLSIWVNPDAIRDAMDFVTEYYTMLIEIAIALFPVFRMGARMVGRLEERARAFGQRFVPLKKADAADPASAPAAPAEADAQP